MSDADRLIDLIRAMAEDAAQDLLMPCLNPGKHATTPNTRLRCGACLRERLERILSQAARAGYQIGLKSNLAQKLN